ncbi:MAG TPA: prolipoprotein diacylglyceryl transferase [Fibrobacteria bacterium]|nr:prolipoprotein diacylglyceryl transferase [Fibrobacteria bacterium]
MGGFLYWWQNLPERMDPILFSFGSFRVQWYGMMYILAYTTVYLLARFRTRREERFRSMDDEFLKNILTWAFIGTLAGGRLGYVLFYNLPYYLDHPLEIILPFRSGAGGLRFTGISGMSYHGGIIGIFVACAWFCHRYKTNFWNLCDLFAPIAALAYTFGRLGNFINGELYGRVTEAAIGMRFPESPDPSLLRHPSQLYEGFFEGIVLGTALLMLRKAPLPKGAMMALYLFGYGLARFCIEWFREPDAHLGFVFLRFSMGQMLCFVMMVAGAGLYAYLTGRERREASRPPAAVAAPRPQP